MGPESPGSLVHSLHVHQLEADACSTCRDHLPGIDLDDLVEREPMVFQADICKVLHDVQRLLGSSVDPVKYLAANPREVIDMQQGGMLSSAESGADHCL